MIRQDSNNVKTERKDWLNFSDRYDEYRPKFERVMTWYAGMWDDHLVRISVVMHRMELAPSNARPAHSATYRDGPRQRALAKIKVDKMLEERVIEPAKSEWASSVVLNTKKDGRLPFCLYYCRLDTITVPGTYCIPLMAKCIDSLRQAKIFSTLDANSRYQPVEMGETDMDTVPLKRTAGCINSTACPSD